MPLIDVRRNYKDRHKDIMSSLEVSNPMAMPRIEKVSINVGLGQHRQNKDMVSYIADSLAIIAGQKPVATKARKSIAGFKVREGDIVGYRVTLRGDKMNDFLGRLLNIALPRIREFRGIDPKNFDRQGSLTIGLRDQIAFPELGTDAIDKQFGLTITLTISKSDPKKSLEMLKLLGFPMKTE